MRAYFGPLTSSSDILEEYNRLFSDPPKIVGVDIETRNLDDTRPVGIGFATPQGHSFYFSIDEFASIPWHFIRPSAVTKVWYNAPFDLNREALGPFSPDMDNFHDGVLLARQMTFMGNTLEEASQFCATQAESMKDVLDSYGVRNTLELPPERLAEKCCKDALATLQFFLRFQDKARDPYYITERKFLSCLLKISLRGIKLDKERVVAIDRELESNMVRWGGRARSLGFNPHSNKQVATMLNAAGVYLPLTRANNPSSGAKVLFDITKSNIYSENAKRLARLILNCRKYRKLHDRTHKWLDKDRVYSTFTIEGITGRTTSRDENLQNLPSGYRDGDIIPNAGKIRSCFIPDKIELDKPELDTLSTWWESLADAEALYGDFNFWTQYGTKWDYSQLELRILAYLSQDKAMLEILNSPNGDLHRESMLAMEISSRVASKNFNFGMIYGGDTSVLIEFTGIQDPDAVVRMKRLWARRFPDAWAFIQENMQMGLETLRANSYFGREMNLTHTFKELTPKHLMNCGINYPIQSTATDVFKRGTIIMADYAGVDNILSEIHDECWMNGIHEIPNEMEWIIPDLHTPVEVSYVPRFG